MEMTDQERTYATWMHLAGLTSYIGVPLGHILVPLVLWAIKYKESPFLDRQGREILNFQLSITFYLIFAYILIAILIGFLFVALALSFNDFQRKASNSAFFCRSSCLNALYFSAASD